MAGSLLKLGTRKSLLAWAQSSWVARQIEKHNPGVRVELVGIETRGDRIQDISLQAAAAQTGGKEFFVAEIDDALRSGNVDFTVHSMKDLSLDRPSEFTLAAIPPRENPRDVILFGPQIFERLKTGAQIRIGTSSPRRLENIPSFLEKALPQFHGKPQLQFVEIRGNVNTRLGRVHESLNSERQLDAVVLAFAGLIRLWKDEKGQQELKKLLQGVRWMVLPLRECPAAPAQGALAIECRANDSQVLQALRKIHCESTASHVGVERTLLAAWGGGCHQKFGATAVSTQVLEKLFFIRGRRPEGQFVEELRWNPPAPVQSLDTICGWDGSRWRVESPPKALPVLESDLRAAESLFIAHARALPSEYVTKLSPSARIWTSGVSSWFRLANLGIWVEGCAENLGFETIRATLAEGVLQLPDFETWSVLTHDQAGKGWNCRIIPTYQLGAESYSDGAAEALKQATHVFWGSASQFNELKQHVSSQVQHACGPGKTADALIRQGLRPHVFPSVEDWRKWINAD